MAPTLTIEQFRKDIHEKVVLDKDSSVSFSWVYIQGIDRKLCWNCAVVYIKRWRQNLSDACDIFNFAKYGIIVYRDWKASVRDWGAFLVEYKPWCGECDNVLINKFWESVQTSNALQAYAKGQPVEDQLLRDALSPEDHAEGEWSKPTPRKRWAF